MCGSDWENDFLINMLIKFYKISHSIRRLIMYQQSFNILDSYITLSAIEVGVVRYGYIEYFDILCSHLIMHDILL